MTAKRWMRLTLSLLAGALLCVALLVYCIDPFEVYRQAERFIPPIANGTQLYSNAGIAKNYAYDSAVFGSSMTENFLPSQLGELLGGSFVKLPVNAGSPHDQSLMMEMAFATHTLRTAIYSIDVELMSYFYKSSKTKMPLYLYDENPANDVYYWFNRSVLSRYVPACLRTWGQTDPQQRDTMYFWGNSYPYGPQQAMAGITIPGTPIAQGDLPESPLLDQQIRLNVEENILPYVQAHPETQFLFFFPPYSLARWLSYYNQGKLCETLAQKEAIALALMAYPNVQVFDFQAELSWIANLDNYIDDGHYGPWINEAMAIAFADGAYRVTDFAELRQHDEDIRRWTEQIVSEGRWPERFE